MTDRARLAAAVALRGVKVGVGRLSPGAFLPMPLGPPVQERLLIAPQDLRTADPTQAVDIYAGRFTLAGQTVVTEDASIFEEEPPSPAFAAALHGFVWLRHLRAADTALAHANARVLVDDWLAAGRAHDPIAFEPVVVARRVLSWLSQAPLIIEGTDRESYRRFLRGLARQVRLLRRIAARARDGVPRLTVLIALTEAALCLAGSARALAPTARRLADELDRQVLPDGGHVSRNPAALIEILLDLLPLRQTFAARNLEVPQPILNAIDRMLPMLRFFRHGDGSFAAFNGMGAAPLDVIATILAFDDAHGRPVLNATHAGYQRLEGGETMVIVDTAPPPPLSLSDEAHAGCLSFEMSSGRQRIVVNCGLPQHGREAWTQVARATAAHSTLVVEDTSSCRFVQSPRMQRLVGTPIVAGPREVPVERRETAEGSRIAASHDGYAQRFGLLHERTLTLSREGERLEGLDVLRPAVETARQEPRGFAVRFHLHPSVRASRVRDGHAVLLALPNREVWSFAAIGGSIAVEESVFLAGAEGPRRTEQIVVSGSTAAAAEVVWTFQRTDRSAPPAARRARQEPDPEEAELPLA